VIAVPFEIQTASPRRLAAGTTVMTGNLVKWR
jgi:hypothetical protein